jgi:hypothetical protein
VETEIPDFFVPQGVGATRETKAVATPGRGLGRPVEAPQRPKFAHVVTVRRLGAAVVTRSDGSRYSVPVDDAGSCLEAEKYSSCTGKSQWHQITNSLGHRVAVRCPRSLTEAERTGLKPPEASRYRVRVFSGWEYQPWVVWPQFLLEDARGLGGPE